MIRAAEKRDAAEIAALWNWMIRETLATFTTVEKPLQDIEATITARPDAFLVAVSEGRLQGFATFGPFRSGPGYAATAEHTVIISSECHGKGVGSALMRELESRAKAQGMHTLIGAVSGVNAPAIAFHRSQGYAEAGRLPQVGRKSGQWLDLVLMQKIL